MLAERAEEAEGASPVDASTEDVVGESSPVEETSPSTSPTTDASRTAFKRDEQLQKFRQMEMSGQLATRYATGTPAIKQQTIAEVRAALQEAENEAGGGGIITEADAIHVLENQ
tara:strand:+ start:41 stop:382 length:342 start_codon:yes stop_codon:yes gene_type:complete